ncbi:MAG: nuclease-like protein [Pseudomonadota bacterium]|nr:nuclease-like protein [Pseudomonadota bacterium]
MRYALAAAFLLLSATAGAWDVRSYAFINDDGSLRVRGRTIHLYGILIPPTAEVCRSSVRPIKCASRAALALDFKIGPGFVGCYFKDRHADGSYSGICYADGDDLAAYLLEQGWAAAAPGAPPEYVVLENIARAQDRGLWSIPLGESGPLPRR